MARQECDYYGGGYSTSEVLTGDTWIDGKPIYRRVYKTTWCTGTAGTSIVKTETVDLGATELIKLEGFISRADGWRTRLNSYQNATWFANYNITNKALYLQDGNLNQVNAGRPVFVIFEYTK